MRTADVVIIGGGCVGTSALFHLATNGCAETVLLEADSLGAGATSKAAGGIRLQHNDELNTRLTLRSLAEFVRFEDLTGTPVDFKQVGYLMLLDNEGDLRRFRQAADSQRSLGVPTEIVDVETARAMVPGLAIDDLVGATYCPLEGYATPEALVQGYARAARGLGASIEVGTRGLEILADESGVVGVRTTSEIISTRHVVIAAGLGSGDLARPLGLDLPVQGEARSLFYSSDSGGVPDDSPLVVDFSTGFYFHREGIGLVFGGRERELAELSEPATHRLPAIADLPIESSWWGHYDMSPDHNAMIGHARTPGVHYATGFSGHGFMQSPAVGEHLAESILGLDLTLDLTFLSADRFVEGRQRVESFVI